MKVRKVPMRMCVGCRQMRPKRDLVRVVRSPQGEVSFDPVGKKPGRGAYLCYDLNCLRRALKGKQLDRALETPLTEAVATQLQTTLQNLPPPDPEEDDGDEPARAADPE